MVAERLRIEARASFRLASPLYDTLIERSAQDVERGGPLWAVLDGLHEDIRRTFLVVHLMGAVHRLVLEGRAPGLAAHFPSAGGDGNADAAWEAMRTLVSSMPEEVRRYAKRPVQTNEPGRSCALLGGFLLVAERTGLPLRVLEVGTSGGLNLRWDRFFYASGARSWGDARSPARFAAVFEDRTPPVATMPEVVERAGCDADPVDPTTEDGRLTLMSYVWADQASRLVSLDGAIAVARVVPARVDRADALDWLPSRLERPVSGVATVVFHSLFSHYLSSEQRETLVRVLAVAGARATPDAPLAELSLEPRDLREQPPSFEVRLRSWPDGTDELLARSGPHGPPVRWLA